MYMINKHTKRYSASLVIREMVTKTTIRIVIDLTEMLKIKIIMATQKDKDT
jgi:hypothetical protein